MHNEKECTECKLLRSNQGSRSMGFSEEEIYWRKCRKALQALEEQANERREWDHYHN